MLLDFGGDLREPPAVDDAQHELLAVRTLEDLREVGRPHRRRDPIGAGLERFLLPRFIERQEEHDRARDDLRLREPVRDGDGGVALRDHEGRALRTGIGGALGRLAELGPYEVAHGLVLQDSRTLLSEIGDRRHEERLRRDEERDHENDDPDDEDERPGGADAARAPAFRRRCDQRRASSSRSWSTIAAAAESTS